MVFLDIPGPSHWKVLSFSMCS